MWISNDSCGHTFSHIFPRPLWRTQDVCECLRDHTLKSSQIHSFANHNLGISRAALFSMDNQFQNDSGFIDRHQSRSRAADMPQLTSFGLECMDSWADCFDNMKVGNASDLTMQPFEFPQAGKRPDSCLFLPFHVSHMIFLSRYSRC